MITQSLAKDFESIEYKGINLFEWYVSDATEFIATELGVGTTYDYEAGGDCGDCEGSGCELCDGTGVEVWVETESIEGQEVYFGFIPSTDTFVCGYDMWGDNGLCNVVSFKLDSDRRVTEVETIDTPGRMFYSSCNLSKQTGYKALHNKFNDLIDIRLD